MLGQVFPRSGSCLYLVIKPEHKHCLADKKTKNTAWEVLTSLPFIALIRIIAKLIFFLVYSIAHLGVFLTDYFAVLDQGEEL